MKGKDKIYFVSDLHLGAPDYESSLKREKRFVRWLDEIKVDASALYLMGDVYDFWFEYSQVIPKYFSRLHGKLAELSDSGVDIHFFSGNHDMWMFSYYEKELQIKIHHSPIEIQLGNKLFYLGHGDGLGPGDTSYKLIKKIFRSRVCQVLFSWIHPDLGMGIANYWSKTSRVKNANKDAQFLGDDEWLLQYAKHKLSEKHVDIFIFGHRHFPMDLQITESSRYINLGDWISYYTYAVFDGNEITLKSYE